ncbi:17224_t:CDS:2 [Entrophospora sp. SA101]|nr:1599_t:CDS:2 [Entrophospora sp. SA101]CAJ0751302.1 17224_t:CDS:2 [Entrophospora sp. SA101]
MAGKYAPVPANDPYTHGDPAINSPATLRVCARAKYQRETVGTKQSAIQKLTQEKFQPFDTPDTYSTSFIRSNAPAGINEFFIALKNMWLERSPNLYGGSISNQISQMPSITPQSTITSTEIMKPESELQSNNSGITKTEIENIVNSQLDLRIQETQTQSQQPTS